MQEAPPSRSQNIISLSDKVLLPSGSADTLGLVTVLIMSVIVPQLIAEVAYQEDIVLGLIIGPLAGLV